MILNKTLSVYGIRAIEKDNFLYGVIPNQPERYTFWVDHKDAILSPVEVREYNWVSPHLVKAILFDISEFLSTFVALNFSESRKYVEEVKRVIKFLLASGYNGEDITDPKMMRLWIREKRRLNY